MFQVIYDNFVRAANRNNLEEFNRIISLCPLEQVHQMIAAHQFGVFSWSVAGGRLAIINRIIELSTFSQIQDMIAVDNFNNFRMAAISGNLNVFNRIVELMTTEQIQNIFADENYQAFSMAAAGGYLHILNRITELATTEQVQHMIATQNFLPFRMALSPVLYGRPQMIIRMLELMTPAQIEEIISAGIISALFLNELAADNLPLPLGLLGLGEAAQNPESSMQVLTPAEEKQLTALRNRYQNQIEDLGGVDATIAILKDSLKKRYLQTQPKIEVSKKLLELPFDWQELMHLGLSGEEKEQALKMYYQHPDHSAFRYFMKPNPWIAQDASFIHRNEAGAWSCYANFTDLIAILFLAAIDESMTPIDGFSIEGRLNHFIQELGLIGRAHNWDNSRLNPISLKYEQYDDLGPDKPSCSLGTKSRLFQSVLGHPLLKFLTDEILDQELKEFVRDFFKAQVNIQNAPALLSAWSEIIEEGASSNQALIGILNIPQDRQEAFLLQLQEKYGPQFEDFRIKLQAKLSFTSHFPNHASRFGGEIDLLSILEGYIKNPDTRQVLHKGE